MLIQLKGGSIYDPHNGINGKKKDLYLLDGKIVRKPGRQRKIDKVIDITDKVVMAGGIDIHTHIGGGKVNIARMLMPEDHLEHPDCGGKVTRGGSGYITPTSHSTGYRYAANGYG